MTLRLATAMKILSNIHEILEEMSERQFSLRYKYNPCIASSVLSN